MFSIHIIHDGAIPSAHYGWDMSQIGHPRKNFNGDILVSDKRVRYFDLTDQVVYNRASMYPLLKNETLNKVKILFNHPQNLMLDNKWYFWKNFPQYCQIPTYQTKRAILDAGVPFPIIAKPVKGAESRLVVQLKSKEEMNSLNAKYFIFQPLVPIEKEYKLYIIDNEIAIVMLRNRSSFVVGKGFVQEDYVELPLDVLKNFNYKPIKEYFDSIGHTICSLDLLETPDGTQYILEANFTFGYKWHNVIGKAFWREFNKRVRVNYE